MRRPKLTWAWGPARKYAYLVVFIGDRQLCIDVGADRSVFSEKLRAHCGVMFE